MDRQKQFVFSARTTEAGLKALNDLKAKLNVGWDELVIDGMSAHYNLDKAVMALPKKEAPPKAEEKKPEATDPIKEARAKEQETAQPPMVSPEKKEPVAKGKGSKKKGTVHNVEKVG